MGRTDWKLLDSAALASTTTTTTTTTAAAAAATIGHPDTSLSSAARHLCCMPCCAESLPLPAPSCVRTCCASLVLCSSCLNHCGRGVGYCGCRSYLPPPTPSFPPLPPPLFPLFVMGSSYAVDGEFKSPNP